MKKLLLIPILLSALCQALSAKEAILRLDTGGHTTAITRIIVTQSKDIISASADKTIRVWDSSTGREKRKILGEISAGSEGKIFAIALSPDEKYLAVGGYLTGNRKSGERNAVRIYNYPTGKLIKVLKSHTNIVKDLAFSEDGSYLISGSSDSTAKIWNVLDNFALKDTISFHTKRVNAARIIKKEDRYFAVTAGDDNQIALYDMQKRKIVKSRKGKHKPQYLATASNLFNGRIAVCGDGKEIVIYDFDLKFIKKVKSETVPSRLVYSPDGKLLIAGVGGFPYNVNIYQSKNNYRKTTSFKKHTNSSYAVAFLDNYTAVSAGGNNSELYLWDSRTAKVKKKIAGAGASVWSVGVNGDTIGWGNKNSLKAKNKKDKLQKTLNLKTMQISSGLSNKTNLKRISTTSEVYSLSHTSGEDYRYRNAVLILKRNQKEYARITRDYSHGLGHYCYGFYQNYIISGGAYGYLKLYSLEGKIIANLIGHEELVASIAVDGDRLVSGSIDQTIRVWDLSSIGSSDETIDLEPQLNIFTTKDNEWVIWSQSGYFASSVNGDQYIGYHINQGPDKEAYFVSSAKYYDKLYRPDIIQAILETGSEKRAIESISRKRKVEKADIVTEMPPILTLMSDSALTTDDSSTVVKFAIESASRIEKMIVTLNGRQIDAGTLPQGETGTLTIDLDNGENIISIRTRNKYALSDAVLVRATKKTAAGTTGNETIYKPTLYLLSIGVSQYKNKEYNLEVADKDAKSIIEMFKKQEGKIYKKVVSKELTNETATKDNILDALEWIERETTQRDMVIIFVAGHGINDDKGNYYFMAYDSDVDKLRRSALRWIEIKDTISDLPSKVILMVDTCHSGNIMGQERRRDITGAIKSIINSGTGSVIMTASTGRGYSIENNSWGHGAFTKALIEGIERAKADYNNNRTITIKEIDLYVTERVKRLTKGKQKPTTIIPESVPDFAVGVR